MHVNLDVLGPLPINGISRDLNGSIIIMAYDCIMMILYENLVRICYNKLTCVVTLATPLHFSFIVDKEKTNFFLLNK